MNRERLRLERAVHAALDLLDRIDAAQIDAEPDPDTEDTEAEASAQPITLIRMQEG